MTNREAREVLKSLGAHPECPSCRRTSWSARPDAVVSTKDEPGEISAHVFLCNSCGFMRLHAVEVLTGSSA
jgi:hypothetical protein